MMKYFLAMALVIPFFNACSNSKSELKVDEIKQNEEVVIRKSTHQQDSEKYSPENMTNKISDQYKITVKNIEKITDKSIGNFINPLFTDDGKSILFTTNDYNQIWIYNIENELLEKIIDMSQCGNGFQISDNGNFIYFRNRAKNGKKSGGTYSFFEYSINNKKTSVLYSSEKRISIPIYVDGNLNFIEEDVPKRFNISTKTIDDKFYIPFFYVMENKLLRLHNRVDTISFNDSKFNFVKCDISRDGKYVSALTANNGILILNTNGEIVKQLPSAIFTNILNNSNLILFTEENDDGEKILDSKMKIGFINSDKIFDISEELSESTFNPNLSPSENKIAFNTENGVIKIITLKIENKLK